MSESRSHVPTHNVATSAKTPEEELELQLAGLLDESDNGGMHPINEQVLLAVANSVQTSEVSYGGRMIPGTDEWVDFKTKTTYSRTFTDDAGVKHSFSIPEDLGARLVKFRTDREAAAAQQASNGSATPVNPGKATSPADTRDTDIFKTVEPLVIPEPTDLAAARARKVALRPQGPPIHTSGNGTLSTGTTAPKQPKAAETVSEPKPNLTPEQQTKADAAVAKIGDIASFKLIQHKGRNGKDGAVHVYGEREEVHTSGKRKGEAKLKHVSYDDVLAAYGYAGQTQGTKAQFEARQAQPVSAQANQQPVQTGQTAPAADPEEEAEKAEAAGYGITLDQYRAIMGDDTLSATQKFVKLMETKDGIAAALAAPTPAAPRNNYDKSGLTDDEYTALSANPNLTEQQKIERMTARRMWAQTIELKYGMTPAQYRDLANNPRLSDEGKKLAWIKQEEWAQGVMKQFGLTGVEYSAIANSTTLTNDEKIAKFKEQEAWAKSIDTTYGLTGAQYKAIAFNSDLSDEEKAKRFAQHKEWHAQALASQARGTGFKGFLRRVFTKEEPNGERKTRKGAVVAVALGAAAIAVLATDKIMEAKYGAGFLPWSSGIGGQGVRGAIEQQGGNPPTPPDVVPPQLPGPDAFTQAPAPVAPELHLTGQGDTIWHEVTTYLGANGYPTDDVTVDTVKDAVLASNNLTEAGAENLQPGFVFNIPPEVLEWLRQAA